MRFVYVLGNRRKYQNKIAKAQYNGMKHQRKAQKHAAAMARWAALSSRQKAVIVGAALVFVVIVSVAGH